MSVFTGTSDGDIIGGTPGGDVIVGNAGADYLAGNDGDDVIYAHTRDVNGLGWDTDTDRDVDTIHAGGGDDVIYSYVGDIVDGGAGLDHAVVNLARSTVAETVDLGLAATGTVTLAAGGSYTGVESFMFWAGQANDSITGGANNDILIGEGGNDTLSGGAGDDYLNGVVGLDSYVGGDGNDRISFFSLWNTHGASADLRTGVISNDGFGNVEQMSGIEGLGGGGRFTDTFYGDDGDNFFVMVSGDSDADVVQGFGGSDSFQLSAAAATVDGGAGIDTITIFTQSRVIDSNGDGVGEWQFTSNGVHVDLAAGRIWNDGFGRGGVVIGIENVGGSAGDDNLRGDAGANALTGFGGKDNLNGAAGDDTLNGGAGDDYLVGGEGNDRIDGGEGAGDVAAFVLPNGTPGRFQVVDGTEPGQLLVQRVDGATVETVFLVSTADGVTTVTGVNSAAGLGSDTVRNVEQLHFYVANDPFNADQFVGVNLSPRQYGEWITGSEIGDSIAVAAYLGAKNVDGGRGDDAITGDGQDNYLIGGAGSDRIDGGGGRDVASFQLAAGTAGTLRVVDGTGENAGKLVVERVAGQTVEAVFLVTLTGSGATVQGVNSAASLGTDTVSNIEDLHFFVRDAAPGTQFTNISLTPTRSGEFVGGGEGGDVIDLATYSGAINANGNRGDDVIYGTAGANYLIGGAGSDQIDGRGGSDIAAFQLPSGTTGTLRVVDGAGTDTGNLLVQRVDGATVETVFVVTVNGGVATVQGVGSAANLGTDTAVNVEDLHFSVINGPQFANIRLSPAQFGSFVAGGEGSDSIDLTAFPGAVNANGNRGDDLITGGAEGNALQGGAGADSLFGAGGDDFLQGQAGDDLLDGGLHNDNLRGLEGNDTLLGGEGNDLLRGGSGVDAFHGGPGVDRVSFYELGATQAVVVDLRTQTVVNDGFGNTEAMSGIEDLGAGTVFADTFHGDDNANFIFGGGGDLIYGYGGDDRFFFGDGPAVLDGGDGVDAIEGFNRFRTIRRADGTINENDGTTLGVHIDLGAQALVNDGWGGTGVIRNVENVGGSANGDVIIGDAAANVLSGYEGADRLDGASGADTLEGGLGDDSLDGGAGLDTARYSGVRASYTIAENAGVVTVTGPDGADTLTGIEQLQFTDLTVQLRVGGAGFDQFIGNTGTDVLFGAGGNDVLDGAAGDDLLVGGAGSDFLHGRAGHDVLEGNEGNDYLVGGFDNDTLLGGAGVDRAGFASGATGGVRVDLNLQGVAQDTGQGLDVLVGIENVSGTIFSDRIVGDGGANWLWGGSNGSGVTGDDTILAGGGDDLVDVGAGQHVLDGGAGTDTASFYGNSTDISQAGVTVSLLLQGAAQDTGQGVMTLTGFENLSGSLHADRLTGDAGNNLLAGGAASDLLSGGDGDDVLVGEGRMAPDTAPTGNSGPIILIEDVSVAFGQAAGADTLDGGRGADQLRGGAGDDLLIGGQGNDTLDGGAGNDTASYSGAGGAVTVDLQAGTATGADGSDVLVSIENVTGSAAADVLLGSAGANALSGGAGADRLQGRGGADTLTGGDDDDVIFHNVTDNPSGVGFNHVYRGSADDNAADLIDAGAGNDRITIGQGDTVDGGGGFDMVAFSFLGFTSGVTVTLGEDSQTAALAAALGATVTNVEDGSFIGSNFGDVFTGASSNDEALGMGGDDLMMGGGGRDILVGGGGFDTVMGGEGDDVLAGSDNVRADGFFYEGWTDGGERDVLDGGAGDDNVRASRNDSANGGEGNDFLYVTFIDQTAGATLDLSANAEAAILGALNITASGFERYGVVGSQFDDRFVLDGSNNIAFGQGGGDAIDGGAGDDILNGQGGNDTLLGGLGDDRLYGHAGDDVIAGGDGNDQIADEGYIIAISSTGAPGGNDSFDGGAGNDSLSGGAGSDTLRGGADDDRLDGGDGNDVLDGGAGTDTAVFNGVRSAYTISVAGGVVTLAGPQGVDIVSGVERLQFADLTLEVREGTGGDDFLYGGPGAELFIGGSGNDYFRGAAGVDAYHGGDGVDRISFYNPGATQGVVADLRTQTISNDGFGNAETMTSIEGLGGGTRFADVFHGDDNANFLLAGGGDLAMGYGGNDTFQLDDAPATVDGGAGIDTISVFTQSRQVDANGDGVAEVETTTRGVSVDLAAGRILDDGFGGLGVLVSIENVGGSAGNDTLLGDGGANGVAGYEGDDRLEGRGGDDTLDGGAGSDTLDGGEGSDRVVIEKAAGASVVTLGAGVDTVNFGAAHAIAATTTVRDFATGDSGDVLSLQAWLTGHGVISADPFASGHLRLVQDGTATLVQANADGAGFSTLAVLENTTATAFTAANFAGLQPAVTVVGGAGDGVIEVGYGSTVTEVDGGAGVDVVSITAPEGAPAVGIIRSDDGLVQLDFDGDGQGDLTLRNVEDLILNGEKVVISGSFDGTGLSRDTIRVNGTPNADVVDASGLTSPHSVVASSGAGADRLTGGPGDDTLDGGAGDDWLFGRGEADRLIGGGGADTLNGGDGMDVLSGGAGQDVFVVNPEASTVATKHGAMTVDVITDFDVNGGDLIDLRGFDADTGKAGVQGFSFVGLASGKTGQLSYSTYGNVNAAEAALGVDLDGMDGPGAAGPVTIIWGNTDADKDAEFAIVLLGVKGVSEDDFLFNSTGIV